MTCTKLLLRTFRVSPLGLLHQRLRTSLVTIQSNQNARIRGILRELVPHFVGRNGNTRKVVGMRGGPVNSTSILLLFKTALIGYGSL